MIFEVFRVGSDTLYSLAIINISEKHIASILRDTLIRRSKDLIL
jgi:hypothetical protein